MARATLSGAMRSWVGTILFLCCCASAATWAQSDEPASWPHGSVSFAGGVSLRNTQLTDNGTATTTTIERTSPTYLALKADWYFFKWLGLEGEGLTDLFFVTGNGVAPPNNFAARAGVRGGLSARYVAANGFQLSGSLGYGYARAPIVQVQIDGTPNTAAISSNGFAPRLGAGFTSSRFQASADVAALIPLSLYKVYAVEPRLWLGTRVYDFSSAALWVGLDALFRHEALDDPTEVLKYAASTLHLGVGVRLSFVTPPKERVRNFTASLRVQFVNGASAAEATVTLNGLPQGLLDAQGSLSLQLTPGEYVVAAALAGHRPVEQQLTVVDHDVEALTLTMVPRTGPGRLVGRVREAATGKSIAQAVITGPNGNTSRTDAEGRFQLESVGPGPVNVRVDAPGFAAIEEVIQVPPEAESTFDPAMEVLGKGKPATVRGLVRSLGGERLSATVTIKGLAQPIQVTPEGRFSATVPGGEYLFIFSAPGYITQSKRVKLADGDQAIVHVDMQKVAQ